jgi:MtfA peptidase
LTGTPFNRLLMFGIAVFTAIIIAIAVYYSNRKKQISSYELPAGAAAMLEQNVAFYAALSAEDKGHFERRVRDFLATTNIRGVDVAVEELDKLLVASGAIIPIFAFPNWRYNNIAEVLIYKDAFTKDFKTSGPDRNVAGMVGTGALHRQMLLSRPSLRSAFSNENDGQNTVIHEFVHLIDKADGSTDGIPEYLLSRPYIIPWVKEINDTIKDIKSNGAKDIDPYGATNDAEFFAVISEYFFERPDKLKEHHPELYAMLAKMFHGQEEEA